MQSVRMNELDVERLPTFRERLIKFIIQSVEIGHYNLAKLLIDHSANPIKSFSKLPLIISDIPEAGQSTPIQFLNSLYYREVQRVAFENKVNILMYSCLSDLNRMLLEQMKNYKEQLSFPTTELKSMVPKMYIELYQGRVNKLIDEILDLASVKDDSETYVWLDKHCFTISKHGEEFTVRSDGVSSFTNIIFEYTNDIEESSRLIRALIKDSSERDELLEKQFSGDVIDVCSEEYIRLNHLLVKMKRDYLTLLGVVRVNENQPLRAYCNYEAANGERVTKVQHLRNIIEVQLLELARTYRRGYNFDVPYEENEKEFDKLSTALQKVQENVIAKNSKVLKFKKYFEDIYMLKGVGSYLATLNNNELSEFKNFMRKEFGTNILDESCFISLRQQLLPAVAVTDGGGTNLLHTALQCPVISESFIHLLLRENVDIFRKNKNNERPIKIVARRFQTIPLGLYSSLLTHAQELVKPLCLISDRDEGSKTSEVIIEQLYFVIEEYLARTHYKAVKEFRNKKIIAYDKTANRAKVIADTLIFFRDNMTKRSVPDIGKLRQEVSVLLNLIETVISKRRSDMYKKMIAIEEMLYAPVAAMCDRLTRVNRHLSSEISSLHKKILDSQKMNEQQYQALERNFVGLREEYARGQLAQQRRDEAQRQRAEALHAFITRQAEQTQQRAEADRVRYEAMISTWAIHLVKAQEQVEVAQQRIETLLAGLTSQQAQFHHLPAAPSPLSERSSRDGARGYGTNTLRYSPRLFTSSPSETDQSLIEEDSFDVVDDLNP